MLQGTPVNIIVGSHVWVEDPDSAWIDGQVVKISGQEAEIEASDGKKVPLQHINRSELFLIWLGGCLFEFKTAKRAIGQ